MLPNNASQTFPALRAAVTTLQSLADSNATDDDWLAASGLVLAALIAHDDWLPASHAQSDAQYYQQHALHLDAAQRFSISSFVWAPGQGTPIHNHTVPGWVGVLRGGELCQRYDDDGQQKIGPETQLNPGDQCAVTPHNDAIGDVHTVRNAYADRNSISIHIYRGDIAKLARSVFKDGLEKPFQSSYSAAKPLI